MIEERLGALFFIFFGHFCDLLFTVLFIKKMGETFHNPEEMEVNYHKWFFKKFGMLLGPIISGIISMSFLLLIGYFVDLRAAYMLGGMCFMIGYSNFINWYVGDDIGKKLVMKQEEIDKRQKKLNESKWGVK